MNKKLNIEQIENTVDFESVNKRLEALAQSGALRRRKTVSDLLDKMKPSLLLARENKVPFKALAAFLEESGIPVSEPTLRQYINAQHAGVKKKRKRRMTIATGAPKSELVATEPKKKLSPRLVRRTTT